MDYVCSLCRTVSRNDTQPPIAMRPGCRVGSLTHSWKPFPGGVTWKYRCGVAGCDVEVEVVKASDQPPDEPPSTEAGGKCARPDGHRWGAPS